MKTPSPTHHINNNRFLRLITGALLLAAPFAVRAQTNYSLTLNNNYTWDAAPWSPSGIPGAGDTITDITSDSSSTRSLYLESNRQVANLTIAGLGGSGGLRLYNSNIGSGTPDVTLNIANTFTLARSARIVSLNSAARLTVNTTDLVIDSGARFEIAVNSGQQNVTLAVSGTTTFKGGNTAFTLAEQATSATEIDLGHVVFENTLSGGSPGIDILAGTLRARSLAGGGSAGTIRGAGTLVVYGDGPASNTFSSQITGNVRVEKTGSNIQILNPNNNTYSGGTLISGGVLSVNNTNRSGSGLGSGAVTVADHGTLAGTGAVLLGAGNYNTVQSGGTIAPSAHGLAGFSNLIFNNVNKTNSSQLLLKMEEGSAFTFKIDGEGNSDQIRFGYYDEGAVLFEGGQITLNLTGILAEGYVYKLFTFRSGGADGGTLVSSGLTGGLVAGSGFDGYNATFHYDEDGFGGLGVISLTVEAIPEPSTAMLVLLPLAAALLRRRRRTNC